ncbi:MAG: hypothetical protein NWE83_12860, partial [Candidatus Bathyarchaeota archaeon]|nr:hypothetical protein [Candidatus Bathyarchaeota archaeon]
MVKIAIIGAGSHVFARRLITDILSYPELQNSNLCLMDVNQERLQRARLYACVQCCHLIAKNNKT